MPTFQFKGKSFVQNHHFTVPYHELVPVVEKSLTEHVRLNDNLILHGDNLVALKALLPNYAGQVKCVYIDPPYNTGEENWVYNDNVNSPVIKAWLGKIVDKEDLTRHDKWLCMMMPRLQLLHDLLKDNGAIFISCDDNELHHLRSLMDEIFHEENFVATIVWQKRTSPDSRKPLGAAHDYIVVYAKEAALFKQEIRPIPFTEDRQSSFKNPDNDPRGPWASTDLTGQVGHATPDQFFTIRTPGGREYRPPDGRCWALTAKKFEELANDNRIWFGRSGNARPRLKLFKSETEGSVAWTWWTNREVGHNQEATKELNDIFRYDLTFDNPKPSRLIRRIIDLTTRPDETAVILDSFAGSGTTGQAVLASNEADNGNRRFILVEMEDYADSITAERIRRVISGVPESRDALVRHGLPGTFSFFELGQAIDSEQMLSGDSLPSYQELARYLFYTATGQEFHPDVVNESRYFIGETEEHEVYLLYVPDIERLKTLALNMDFIRQLGRPDSSKRRLVFAPARYLTDNYLEEFKIEYAQLPYELYRTRGRS